MKRLEGLFRRLGIIGESYLLKQVETVISQVAGTDIAVLITGESGTGKELVAKAVHEASVRSEGPLVTVNCGAIPEGVFESEIFGHEKSAFTGADRQRKGMFELADGGTIFLDEIGETPLPMQVKLLRVLESGVFMRVGGTSEVHVDVRVVAATNRDMAQMVAEGKFRQDLYYRLQAVSINLPALRERREDIPLLVNHFSLNFCRNNHFECPAIDPVAMDLIREQYWPGNIRELRNFVESLVLLNREGTIRLQDVEQRLAQMSQSGNLPILVRDQKSEPEGAIYQMLWFIQQELQEIKASIFELKQSQSEPVVTESRDVTPKTVEDLEKQHIIDVLAEYKWNRKKAAQALGIGERTIYRKIKKFGIMG